MKKVVEKVKALSLRTQMEQAAGARRIEEAVKFELLIPADEKLAKMFPSYCRNPHLHRSAENPDVWMVDVRMQMSNGDFMNWVVPFLGFPSDVLITEMMLVEP